MSAFLACIFVFPVHLISSAISGSTKNKRKALEKAIFQGHIVTARLVKTGMLRFDIAGRKNGPARLGKYVYQYNGKKYKYRYYALTPPSTLKLYFLRNPRKATVDKALSNSNCNWFLIYASVAALFYVVNPKI